VQFVLPVLLATCCRPDLGVIVSLVQASVGGCHGAPRAGLVCFQAPCRPTKSSSAASPAFGTAATSASTGTQRARRHRQGDTDKVAVFTLVNYETRGVRSRVVNDANGATLGAAIAEQVDMARTALHTDGAKAYRSPLIAGKVREHLSVDHSPGEYVRREETARVSTNFAENYFSQLKRSTHHQVSTEHLDRYLAHFDFVYSYCKWDDRSRMRLLTSRVAGRRLTYLPLTAGVADTQA